MINHYRIHDSSTKLFGNNHHQIVL